MISPEMTRRARRNRKPVLLPMELSYSLIRFFIVGEVIIAELGIAADAESFHTIFWSLARSLNNGFFFFMVGFGLEPFFFRDLPFLVENILKAGLGNVGLDDQPKADHAGDGREPQSSHSITSISSVGAYRLSYVKGTGKVALITPVCIG